LLDQKKAVYLFIENVVWGSVTVVESNEYDVGDIPELTARLMKWRRNYRAKVKSEEFSQETANLYALLLHYRLSGLLRGEFKDREADETIKEMQTNLQSCEQENKKLASYIAQNRLPPIPKDFGAIS